MKIRGGCEGGGKGALVQEELSATLATHQDQTLFESRGCFPINTMLATRYKALGRGTGLGIGNDGDPQYTITKGHEHAVAYSVGDVPDTAFANAGDPQQQVRSSLRWRSWYNLLFVFVIHPGGVWGWAALCGATRLECPRWNHASTPAAMLAKSSCWTLGTISGALCLWLSSSRAITNAAASRSLLIKSQR